MVKVGQWPIACDVRSAMTNSLLFPTEPFITERRYRRGDKLFKKDDAASEMFLTVTGTFLVREIGVELPPGRLMGELGFLTPN